MASSPDDYDSPWKEAIETFLPDCLALFFRPVVSLAILGDERPTWRPERYETELWGYGVRFAFRAVKLLDYRRDLAQLEASHNPFAVIVQAHLQAQETRRDPRQRLAAKINVLRRLYRQGYNREQVVGIFRVVDWLMALPAELSGRFWEELQALEREQKMPYITSIERIGIEKGRQEGLQEGRQEGLQEGLQEGRREGLLDGIELALKIKFGPAGQAIVPEIRRLDDLVLIRAVYDRIETAGTIDEVRQAYA